MQKIISNNEERILRSIVEALVKIANPDKIILFGSHATGKATKDSDYDVCVLKKNANRKKLLHKIYCTGLNAGAPVDIVVTTPSWFEKLKEKSYYVHYDIAKDGKVIYEKT